MIQIKTDSLKLSQSFRSKSSVNKSSVLNYPQQCTLNSFYYLNTYCQGGNIISHLCTYYNCNSNAVLCFQDNCVCKESHKHEKKSIIQPQQIYRSIQQKLDKNSELINYINRFLSSLIDWIYSFQDKINYLGLTEQQIEFYTKKCQNLDSLNKLTGSYMHQIHKKIRDQNIYKLKELNIIQIQMKIQKYWYQAEIKIKNNIEEIENMVFNSSEFFPKRKNSDTYYQQENLFKRKIKIIENPTIKQPLITQFSTSQKQIHNNYWARPFSSKIIYSKEQYQTLFDLIPYDQTSMRFNFLYRASIDNFSINKFREKCQNKSNILILILTKFGKIIGGYTPCKLSISNQKFIQDPTLSSCLFSISNKEKFRLIQKEKAIHFPHRGQTGIGFGNSDLTICSNSYKSSLSYAFQKKNLTYKNSNEQNLNEIRQKFIGSMNSNFQIQQWEVYQIVKNRQRYTKQTKDSLKQLQKFKSKSKYQEFKYK